MNVNRQPGWWQLQTPILWITRHTGGTTFWVRWPRFIFCARTRRDPGNWGPEPLRESDQPTKGRP